MSNDDALNQFGQLLISNVRDEAIDKFELIQDGRMRSAAALELTAKLANFTDEQKKIVRRIVIASVDDVLHNLLWLLEENAENLRLYVGPEGSQHDVAKLSDGLTGELYSDEGWIESYSRYR